MLPILFAFLLSWSYQSTYTDSSGAHCVNFAQGRHEIDFCHGDLDR